MGFKALEENFAEHLKIARTLSVTTIVVPFRPAEERPRDAENWTKFARRLSKLAGMANSSGLDLAWHNHDFEYQTLSGGKRPIDIILSEPNIRWEADVGWIVRAQEDPLKELSRYADRTVAIHVKDVASTAARPRMAGPTSGFGLIDWEAVRPIWQRSPVHTLVVEHDNPGDWRSSAARSFRTLSRLVAPSAD